MKKCESCGELIGDTVSKCFSCGNEQQHIYQCQECGAPLGDSDDICRKCGGNSSTSNPGKLELIEKIEKDKKRIFEASVCLVLIAIIHILVGVISILSPSILESFVNTDSGYGILLLGILYIGAAGGTAIKNRVCTSLGFGVFAGGTVLSLQNFNGLSTGLYIRFFILFTCLLGVFAVFRYHCLKKMYEEHQDADLSILFKERNFKVNPMIFICSFIAIGGIGAMILVITNC